MSRILEIADRTNELLQLARLLDLAAAGMVGLNEGPAMGAGIGVVIDKLEELREMLTEESEAAADE